MPNKKHKFLLILSISLIIVSTTLYRLISYTPPLLDFKKRNFVEKTLDFLMFGWHFTKASIHSDYLKNYGEANSELGKAGWYRKKYFKTTQIVKKIL